MIVCVAILQIPGAAQGPGFRIGRTKDHPVNAGVDNGAEAHSTRLEGDEKLATRQTVVSHRHPGLAQSDDFRMPFSTL